MLIDASSAILVYKVGLFDVLPTAYPLAMVPAVIREVTVQGRAGADAFKTALEKGAILAPDSSGEVHGDSELMALGAGERETLAAFSQGTRFVIVDDRKAALFCRRNQIPYINAMLCARILHESGYVDHSTYHAASGRLQDIGRYAADIIAYARECPIDQLANFWPIKAPKMHRLRIA